MLLSSHLLLTKKKLKISFAESCTGGLLSSTLTSQSGSSKVFSMGLVTYSNDSKVKILKVPFKIISLYGAVSMQCCLSMVTNLSRISKSQVNISITGIAGPGGGSKLKPVGLVYIGIKTGKYLLILENKFRSSNRSSIQKNTVKEVLKNLKEKKYKISIIALGLGEKEDDLQLFEAEKFAEAFTQIN